MMPINPKAQFFVAAEINWHWQQPTTGIANFLNDSRDARQNGSRLLNQQKMERSLKEIADIKAGYSFRAAIPGSENGNYRVIQIKDVDYRGFVSSGDLIKAAVDLIKPEYLTQPGDVLFTSRGTNRRAAVVDETTAAAIFVSQIYALKIKTDALVPEYLAWYLNQKSAQKFLEEHASGSYIQNIRHDVLAQLPVVLPPVETQKRIVEIYRLGLQEREMAEKIAEKRWQVVEKTLLELIKEK